MDDELDSIQDTVRRFVRRELIPLENEFATARLPEEEIQRVQAKAKQSGLWLLDTPEELGGAGLGFSGLCRVWEEMYQAAVVPARYASIFGPQPGPMLLRANDDQREEYLLPVLAGEKKASFAQTEPAAGSDPAGMRTNAVLKDGVWTLNGTKHFITGAGEADFLQVVAATTPGTESTKPRFTVFLVDKGVPGLSITRYDETLDGEKAWEVVLDNVKLGPEKVLGEVGGGFALAQEWLTRGRLQQAARGVAYGHRALQMAMTHVSSRSVAGKKLIDHQAVGFMLVDAHIALVSARLMLRNCAAEADLGKDVRFQAAATKIHCVESACQILDSAIQVHGGVGLMKDFPLAKWFWDIRGRRITEGATEALRNYIIRDLSRQYQAS